MHQEARGFLAALDAGFQATSWRFIAVSRQRFRLKLLFPSEGLGAWSRRWRKRNAGPPTSRGRTAPAVRFR
ncbi:MAG: hypothetical protein A2V87_02630 [Deltaproteobacteria bacterium RBG_16_58_17]|nr:MAG: hypothetical protein A2V87_02630 [Deltaproteobacteria bacterium RBG_16_58_17]OHE16506.1 MAG: hypothetical protein A2X96_06620 [Syntrophobacterales bacterium GWC2_56_13]OHE21084.1 MAG: hypothetical protein A2X95_06730 [Syntrophobacterales bacterium GWF2_56_9]